jgi:hypothetical protein
MPKSKPPRGRRLRQRRLRTSDEIFLEAIAKIERLLNGAERDVDALAHDAPVQEVAEFRAAVAANRRVFAEIRQDMGKPSDFPGIDAAYRRRVEAKRKREDVARR